MLGRMLKNGLLCLTLAASLSISTTSFARTGIHPLLGAKRAGIKITTVVSHAAHGLVESVGNLIHHLRYTHYRFGGNYFDAKRGIYQVDCSHYVDHLVSTFQPRAYASMRQWTRNGYPASKDYSRFIEHLPYEKISHNWYHVKTAGRLLPGDIIAYQYSHTHKSGHVMIVVDKPQRDPRYHNVYRIKVSDSANSGHFNDTRGRFGSGIGMGTMLVKVNSATDTPYQYSWKLGTHWESNVKFSMGRPLS